jgi:hypothetical protein
MSECPKCNIGRVAKPSHMEPKALNCALKKLHLLDANGDKAGQFLDLHPRSVTRMLTGKIPIDARTAMLLRLMIRKKVSPKFARTLLVK